MFKLFVFAAILALAAAAPGYVAPLLSTYSAAAPLYSPQLTYSAYSAYSPSYTAYSTSYLPYAYSKPIYYS